MQGSCSSPWLCWRQAETWYWRPPSRYPFSRSHSMKSRMVPDFSRQFGEPVQGGCLGRWGGRPALGRWPHAAAPCVFGVWPVRSTPLWGRSARVSACLPVWGPQTRLEAKQGPLAASPARGGSLPPVARGVGAIRRAAMTVDAPPRRIASAAARKCTPHARLSGRERDRNATRVENLVRGRKTPGNGVLGPPSGALSIL